MARRQSFWAWGWEDRIPDVAGRKVLGGQVAALLGAELGEPVTPPGVGDLALPAPRARAPASIADLCTTDAATRALCTRGRAWPDILRGLRNDFATAPDLVAQPRDEADVARVLEAAAGARLAVIPRGGGTSVVGGTEFGGDGFAGVICLDLSGLSQVLEVDDVSLHARIQAGATGPALERALGKRGLTLRHFPQSFEFSTLGGWIATRAGGHFATLATHIDDLVASTRMITPAGLWQSRRLPGSGAGPSPDRMVLGSEGILGVITEAWLRVRRRPRWRASAAVSFADMPAAVAATRAIVQARLYPANCRLLDKREALLHGVGGTGHVLLLGFESAHHPVGDALTLAVAAATDHGGTVTDGPTLRDDGLRIEGAGQAGSWRKAFFEAPYLASALATLGIVADTFETACTWSGFAALHADVRAAVRDVMDREAGGGLITCRFTHVYPDGPAPYYTFFCVAPSGGELALWAAIKSAASDVLVRHGATITHHHAVGRTHRPWYDQQRPEPFATALAAAKAALDPQGLPNPGVLIG